MNPGDVVQPKHVGPNMTVTNIFAQQVECVWLDAQGDLQAGGFPPQTLNVGAVGYP